MFFAATKIEQARAAVPTRTHLRRTETNGLFVRGAGGYVPAGHAVNLKRHYVGCSNEIRSAKQPELSHVDTVLFIL